MSPCTYIHIVNTCTPSRHVLAANHPVDVIITYASTVTHTQPHAHTTRTHTRQQTHSHTHTHKETCASHIMEKDTYYNLLLDFTLTVYCAACADFITHNTPTRVGNGVHGVKSKWINDQVCYDVFVVCKSYGRYPGWILYSF
jgi:hypothetical protein